MATLSRITKAQIDGLVNKKPLSGVCIITDYKQAFTKSANPKPYVIGTLSTGDAKLPIKVWAGETCDKMIREEYSMIPVYIEGAADEYNGTLSIVLSNIVAVEGFELEDFMPSKYNVESYSNALKGIAGRTMSKEGFSLLDKILFSNEEYWNRFTLEFAAKTHHDNCKSGLLAHTYKVTYILEVILGLYHVDVERNSDGKLVRSQKQKDLIMMSGILHDIGKILELRNGVYQENSSVTHRFLGAEMLFKFKDDIVKVYNEKFYYDMVSVLLQHHHTFDDKARTLVAYVVHKADELDAVMTKICSLVSDGGEHSTVGETIRLDNETRLTL